MTYEARLIRRWAERYAEDRDKILERMPKLQG